MSTVDTSTWNPDANLNTEIEGIPLNADASIQQTWQALRILMAAVKGDGNIIKSMIDVMQGATATADGASGLVPKPEAGDQDKVLKGDGTWGTLSASDIPNLDASKITSGTIDLARLPAGALERLVTVADQTARYALTVADVQVGDTVKQLDTGLLYFVTDVANLDSDAGYTVYTAGAATAVPWTGVTGKPSTFTPSSHAHVGTEVSLTGYSMPASSSAVASSDTVNDAIGKLEKAMDAKAADSNAVHKTGDTISGNIYYKNSNITRGTAPSNNVEHYVHSMRDSVGNAIAGISTYYYTNKSSFTRLWAFNTTVASGSNIGSMGIGCDASGNVYTSAPTPATSDDSTQIATTAFVKKQGYVLDSDAVHISNAETITGEKTFTAKAVMTTRDVGWTVEYGNYSMRLMVGAGGVNRGVYDQSLGRWVVYATATDSFFIGTVSSSSDERLKTPTEPFPDEVLDAWEDVRWGQFSYLADAEGSPLHAGVVAQRVMEAFARHGVKAEDYHVVAREKREDGSDGYWMVRYIEALAMEAACQRRRADRLEARIAALEERLNEY